jgi:AcrR family transcriptional regulator
MARKYELKRRLERQNETRQRIVEAVVALHEEVGPVGTTISAIAERAGVERLTVYRHFSDELSLFQACSSHFRSLHPLPQIEPLLLIEDPERRLRAGLSELYTRHAKTEAMTDHVLRDARRIPALAQVLQSWYGYLRALRDVLVDGWALGGEQQRLMEAWIGHALEFSTWQSLVRRQGLSNDEAIERLVGAAVQMAAEPEENVATKRAESVTLA